MTDHEQAWAVVFNIKRIEQAVKNGDYKEMNGVKVVDGRHGSKYTRYIPIPNSPHGVNTAPDGIHVVINGKLSPTVSVIDVRKLDDLFDDKIKERDVVVAEPRTRPRAAAHRLRRKGNAFTTAVHRQPDGEVEHRQGQARLRRREGRPDRPEDRRRTISPATTTPRWARRRRPTASGSCRSTSSPRTASFNVGPLKPENDQLIDISGDEMKLVHDGPAFAEPHDICIVHRSKVNPISVWKRDDPMWEEARQWAAKDGVKLEEAANVIRDGNKVRVYMHSNAPQYSLDKFEVNEGDEVTVFLTNMDDIEDLTHGFTIVRYGVVMEIGPAGDRLGHLHRRPTRRALVVLPVVLPRAAHGDVGPDDRPSEEPSDPWSACASRSCLAA